MKLIYANLWPNMSEVKVKHENQTFTLTIPDERLIEVWSLIETIAEKELKKLFDKPVTIESTIKQLEGPIIEDTDEIPF